MNIREATEYWVRGFNAIPQELILKAYGPYFDGFIEITPKVYYCPECDTEYVETEARKLNYKCRCKQPLKFEEWLKEEFYLQDLDVEEIAELKEDYQEYLNTFDEYEQKDLIEKEYYDYLPTWGFMWTFESSLDEDWAYKNLEEMAKLGFRIYECDELGLVFGIDGAGYDFYERHWIPLYEARGLRWHDEEIT